MIQIYRRRGREMGCDLPQLVPLSLLPARGCNDYALRDRKLRSHHQIFIGHTIHHARKSLHS